MSSEKHPKGNRPNDQKSAGPPAKSSEQTGTEFPMTHGLCSSQIVLPWESQEEFDTFHQVMLDKLAPETPTELLFTQRAILDAWRLRRVAVYQLKLARENRYLYRIIHFLERTARYENHFVSSMNKALAALRHHQQARHSAHMEDKVGKGHWFFSEEEILKARKQANRQDFWIRVNRLTTSSRPQATGAAKKANGFVSPKKFSRPIHKAVNGSVMRKTMSRG